jgi:hypothetical protein
VRVRAPEELLALELVQLRVDVRNRRCEARHDDAVERVDAAVGHLDRLVEGDEGGLQGGELDEHVDGL